MTTGSHARLTSDRCFRCGAELGEPDARCAACGGSGALTADEERGHTVYFLAGLDHAVRQGLLTPSAADRIGAPYRERAGLPSRLPPPIKVAPRQPPPPRAPRNPTVMWANGLLYLGAFFVVLTGLLFLLVLGGLGRTLLATAVAFGFMAGGILCRRFEIVRKAGSVFLGTGAMLVPLIFVSFGMVLAESGPLGPRLIWLVASGACFLLYALMAFLGLGSFYSVLTLLAASNAFLAFHSAGRFGDQWLPTVFAVQALVFALADFVGRGSLERRFSPLLFGWGLAWTVPALIGWLVISSGAERFPPLPPLVLLIVLAWIVEWRAPNPVSPVAAGLLQLALVSQGLAWVGAPPWSVGIAWPLLGGLYVGFGQIWRDRLAGRELLVLGVGAAAFGAFPALQAASHGPTLVAMSLASLVLLGAGLVVRTGFALASWSWTLGFAWFALVSLLAPPGGSLEDLALAFLPLVAALTAAALLMRIRWVSWRWTLALLAGLYSVGTIALTTGHAGHQSATLVVATMAGAALFARWRSPWLLLVPASAALGLALSLLLWLDAPRSMLGPGALGLAVSLWTLGRLIRSRHGLVLRLFGAAAAAIAFLIGWASALLFRGDGINWSAHLDGVSLGVIALWVFWESTDAPILRYVAGLILVTAALFEIHALGFRELQAFALPLGLYFTAAAILAGFDASRGPRGGWLAALCWTLAGLGFCLPTSIEAFVDDSVLRSILLLGESFALLLVGLGAKRKGLLAVASTFVIIAGLRMVFQNPSLILPAFVVVSALLIGVGLAVLLWQGARRRGGPQGERAPYEE